MSKTFVIPSLVLGMLLTSGTAFAERGISTFSGKASSISFDSAIKSRSGGERCQGTICGSPVTKAKAPMAEKTVAKKATRSGFRSRCSATFCGLR